MTDFESQGAADKEWFYTNYRQMHGKIPSPSITHVFMERVAKYLDDMSEPESRFVQWAREVAWGDYLNDVASERLGNGMTHG